MNSWHMGITLAFLLPLAIAALWDVASFRIPNFLSVILVALFIPAVVWAPVAVPWPWHVAAAAVMLGAGAGLFALGLLGGGDIKILSAATLWLGMGNLLMFVVFVSLAGAVVTVALVALRFVPLRGRIAVLQPGAAIPYGLAIAMGSAVLAGRLPMLGG